MAEKEKTQNEITVVGIGSGNVATHLYRGLAIAGIKILQIYSRNIETAQSLAKQCKSTAVESISKINTDATVYLVSVPDDAIVSVISQLSDHIGKAKIIAHTTGSVSLKEIKEYSQYTGVFYPLQTFSKSRRMDLYQIPFLIESSDDITRGVLHSLAGKLSKTVQDCNSTQRKHLHVAAVASCNFVNHLLSTAYDYLDQHEVNPHLLDPLMQETLAKFYANYPNDTQTGPAKRGDNETINQHLKLLTQFPEMKAIYELFTHQLKNKYT